MRSNRYSPSLSGHSGLIARKSFVATTARITTKFLIFFIFEFSIERIEENDEIKFKYKVQISDGFSQESWFWRPNIDAIRNFKLFKKADISQQFQTVKVNRSTFIACLLLFIYLLQLK